MNYEEKSQWPYTKRVYMKRMLWVVVRHSVWLLCWKRWYRLRPLILRCFGAGTGKRLSISASARIRIPWNLEIGDESTLGERVRIYNPAEIRIGSRTVISQDASLCSATHDYEDPAFPLALKPISIGDDVWIGAEAFVCPGTTIGNGAVVGAGSVVAGNVGPWTVVAGNPARFLKKRNLRKRT